MIRIPTINQHSASIVRGKPGIRILITACTVHESFSDFMYTFFDDKSGDNSYATINEFIEEKEEDRDIIPRFVREIDTYVENKGYFLSLVLLIKQILGLSLQAKDSRPENDLCKAKDDRALNKNNRKHRFAKHALSKYADNHVKSRYRKKGLLTISAFMERGLLSVLYLFGNSIAFISILYLIISSCFSCIVLAVCNR